MLDALLFKTLLVCRDGGHREAFVHHAPVCHGNVDGGQFRADGLRKAHRLPDGFCRELGAVGGQQNVLVHKSLLKMD